MNSACEKHTKNLRKGFQYWSQNQENQMPTLGDFRWTPDLIYSTWFQAEHGYPPDNELEYCVGASGGGFDALDFPVKAYESKITPSLSLSLNKRGAGKNITIPIPFYGSGMSYGSISGNIMLARAMAAQKWNTFTCTGEGGYPGFLIPYKENVITQVATGLFGVTEKTIQYARIVELKYAQGAKPGLGGHLLADKVTNEVAKMRGSLPWISLFSPFPFHSVYSVEDHKKQLDWIHAVNPEALLSVKISTPIDVDMVAIGCYYAGAHILQIDGGYGSTGAAPEISKKNIAMPIELALPKVHKTLIEEGIREQIVIIASGGIRTAYDIAKAIALGADGCSLATTELVALGCTRCANCERGRGCPFGLTTTDPELTALVDPMWGAARLDNLYASFSLQLKTLLRQLGLNSIEELRGRSDLLRYHAKKV